MLTLHIVPEIHYTVVTPVLNTKITLYSADVRLITAPGEKKIISISGYFSGQVQWT